MAERLKVSGSVSEQLRHGNNSSVDRSSKLYPCHKYQPMLFVMPAASLYSTLRLTASTADSPLNIGIAHLQAKQHGACHHQGTKLPR